MKHLKIAVCGAGQRAETLVVPVVCKLEEVTIVGICDVYQDKAEKVSSLINKEVGYSPKTFTDYKAMFEETKPDACFISASWEAHVEMGAYAMEKGIAVAMEVGGAYSEKDCWKLVDAYEKSKTPFMFLENCCFNKDELLALSLARNGAFGKIVYCHGAYRHDLREEIAYGNIRRHYRLKNYTERNGDNYPTHDLGPIAKIIDINRGNKMISLNSFASKSFGLKSYVDSNDELKDLRGIEFKQGDVVETFIKCENGETISLKLDTTLPTYYSREFTIRGTKGFYVQDTNTALFEGEYKENYDPVASAKQFIDNANKYGDEYLPKMWKDGQLEAAGAGHGGMDYFECKVFVDCLREGKPMPLDVYDAVSWMCITYLSEQSIKKNGKAVKIPDFTRGKYKTRERLDVCELPVVKK